MDAVPDSQDAAPTRLLATLERLLRSEATSVTEAFQDASDSADPDLARRQGGRLRL